ncbi:hypothetical protein KC842_02070 [Candidatus Nomurabacteria bacterium]|nr:hypothetical protein [Candidatus Nomurabacteria bacterium]USN94894.1 MAG: hypothetical protein H6791_00500 [Candidatus Nomurabacteria bacterium]
MSNKKPEMTIDYSKAEEVFGTLYDAFENKTFPFDQVVLPQRRDNMPDSIEWGGRDHALFLFTLCYYMRGQIKSETAVKNLKKIWEDNKDLFDPDYLKFADHETVSKIIEDKLFFNGLGFGSKSIAPQWCLNKVKIANHWSSDPRKLFENVSGYEDALKVVANKGKWKAEKPNGFYGFQEKMVSMLAYFYVDAGIISPLRFPPPIDFHILRVLVSNEVLKISNFYPGMSFYYGKTTDMAREVTNWWLEKHSKDPMILSNVLWLMSRDNCERSPTNGSIIGEYKARSTKVNPKNLSFKMATKRFENTCFRCPIKDSCRYDIPSASYYTHGKLEVRQEKKKDYLVQLRLKL